jgi:hypothetical protein
MPPAPALLRNSMIGWSHEKNSCRPPEPVRCSTVAGSFPSLRSALASAISPSVPCWSTSMT